MIKCLVSGLEYTYQNQGIGGMASSYMVLEIIHTHFWDKETFGSGRSDASNQSLVSTQKSRLSFNTNTICSGIGILIVKDIVREWEIDFLLKKTKLETLFQIKPISVCM